MRSTFWPNRILERQSCQNRQTGLKFSSKRQNSALSLKIVQNALFQIMRTTFWPNRIRERQSGENCHTGLKFSSKRENSALSMKIVENALFRSCASRFAEIAFLRIKLLKIVTLVANSLQNGKTVAFHEISTKRSFQVVSSTFYPNRIFEGQTSENRYTFFSMKFVQNVLFKSCAARFGKSHFWGSKFWKSSHSPEILFKKGKQCAFHKNCTKRSFQIMRSTFCPSRIFKGQTSENRYTCLKFSSKREDSALFMKIVQNALFRSCAARISQIAFVSVNVLKIVSHTGLKFSSKRENSALSMKIVQNALFRSCAARFGQIALLSVKVVKIVTLASNSLQKGKTVRFPWKLYKTLFSGHAQHVLAKIAFVCVKVVKIVTLAPILSKRGKQCAFHKNCTKPSFQVMRSTFWPNRILERQTCQNRQTGLKFSSKRENSPLSLKIVQNALFRSCAARFGQIALVSVKVVKIVTLASNSLQKGKTVCFPWKLYKTLFSGHAQHVLAKSHSWASKWWKLSHWPQILSKKGKQCAYHENCTKRSFQVMRSTFCPNRNFQRQSSQNRHTDRKFSSKRENSTLSIKIVQNALFTSCGACFGQIAFLRVKVVKIVKLAWNCPRNGKKVHFPWKLYKTLFWDHAHHVLAKSHSWAWKWWKLSHWPEILFKKGKQCAFHEICTKRSF